MLPEVLLAAVAAGLVLLLGFHAVDWVWARRLVVRRRVLVNLVGEGRAVQGVLWARRAGFLVLKDAQLLEPGREPVRMDGDVLVERGRVEFVQAVGEP